MGIAVVTASWVPYHIHTTGCDHSFPLGGALQGGGGRGYVVFSVDCLSLTVRYRRFLNRKEGRETWSRWLLLTGYFLFCAVAHPPLCVSLLPTCPRFLLDCRGFWSAVSGLAPLSMLQGVEVNQS